LVLNGAEAPAPGRDAADPAPLSRRSSIGCIAGSSRLASADQSGFAYESGGRPKPGLVSHVLAIERN